MEKHKNNEPVLRILLVEDDEHDQVVFRRAFNKAPFPSKIQNCVRGEEALEIVSNAASSVDILVTDYLLPGMTGLELCKELLDKKISIPMVILTGSGSENVAVEAFKAGVNDYIVKDPDQGYLKLIPFVIHDNVQNFIERHRRLEAEKALTESQNAYKTVADFTYDWEYWIDPEENYLYVSPSCRRITGYRPDDFIGNPKLMEKIIHPEDLPDFLQHEKEVTHYGKAASIDFRITTREGEERWISHVCQSVFDDEGQFIGKRGSNRDMTQEKKLQQKSMRTHQMEAIGTLAGGIAHQFNNALSIITGNLDLLEDDLPGNAIVNNYSLEIKRAAERMRRLTMQLLAYARGGKYQAQTKPLTDFLKDTLPIIRHSVHPGITIETDLTSDRLSVHMDQAQMQMVLSAVLSNASEAMDRNGLIRIVCRKILIDAGSAEQLSLPMDGTYACLTVADTGRGMDEATRSRIFEPFFTTNFKGRGLGMAAAFGIVENHDGTITVSSDQDQGTTVRIYLPLVDDASIPKESAPQTHPVEGEGTILVIDDEEGVIKLCRSMLERMGYRVLEAKTGAEAIAVVQQHDKRIDLALLDVLMPDIKGDSLYPLLKNLRNDMKILVSSGYAMDSPVKNILEAGADGFIQKPYTKIELSKKINEILNGKTIDSIIRKSKSRST